MEMEIFHMHPHGVCRYAAGSGTAGKAQRSEAEDQKEVPFPMHGAHAALRPPLDLHSLRLRSHHERYGGIIRLGIGFRMRHLLARSVSLHDLPLLRRG
jgi:hypothetical protein